MNDPQYIHSLIGKKVKRTFILSQGDEEKIAIEVGIIVYSWWDEMMQEIDCYIAFHGETFLQGVPKEKPYVLRYYLFGLEIIDE